MICGRKAQVWHGMNRCRARLRIRHLRTRPRLQARCRSAHCPFRGVARLDAAWRGVGQLALTSTHKHQLMGSMNILPPDFWQPLPNTEVKLCPFKPGNLGSRRRTTTPAYPKWEMRRCVKSTSICNRRVPLRAARFRFQAARLRTGGGARQAPALPLTIFTEFSCLTRPNCGAPLCCAARCWHSQPAAAATTTARHPHRPLPPAQRLRLRLHPHRRQHPPCPPQQT